MRVLKHDPECALVHDGEIDLAPRHLPGTHEQRAPALDGAQQRGDIPALLLSALAHLLDARESHRIRHSEFRSLNSFASSSAVEDDYDEHNASVYTPSMGSTGVSRSIPGDCRSEDDLSDALSSSPSICSGQRRGRKSEGALSINEDNERVEDTVNGQEVS